MLNIQRDYSLLGHNTFGIEARTAAFVEYSSEAELLEAARMLNEGALPSPWLHIGGGSNLLLTRDWPGTVLHSRITTCETVSENEDAVEVRVGSGVVWDEFVEMCVGHGWYGAENLSAIPGETGAAAVQNIGAYGVEVKDLILEVETLDMVSGQKKVFRVADCGYGYRRSIFKQQDNKRYVVLSVLFRLGLRPNLNLGYKALSEALSGRDNITLGDVREAVRAVRSSKLPDPSEVGSAGSFFPLQAGRAAEAVAGNPFLRGARHIRRGRSGQCQAFSRLAYRAVWLEGTFGRTCRSIFASGPCHCQSWRCDRNGGCISCCRCPDFGAAAFRD